MKTKSACELSTPEDRVRYDSCNHSAIPITWLSIGIIIGMLAVVFFIDWLYWGGKVYLDDFFAFLPHLRLHHFHDGIGILLVAGGVGVVWLWRRAMWCCEHRWLVQVCATLFYFCILAGIYLIIRDFSDVLLWWETGNFFPDPP